MVLNKISKRRYPQKANIGSKSQGKMKLSQRNKTSCGKKYLS